MRGWGHHVCRNFTRRPFSRFYLKRRSEREIRFIIFSLDLRNSFAEDGFSPESLMVKTVFWQFWENKYFFSYSTPHPTPQCSVSYKNVRFKTQGKITNCSKWGWACWIQMYKLEVGKYVRQFQKFQTGIGEYDDIHRSWPSCQMLQAEQEQDLFSHCNLYLLL